MRLLIGLLLVNLKAFSCNGPHTLTTDTFPTPTGIHHLLFYVQRNHNINTIVYQLNVNEKKELDKNNPIKIFWIRYAEKKQHQELSYIQRAYAYGLKTKKLNDGQYELRFVSYKKLPFYLSKSDHDGQYHVFATIQKKRVLLNRIFLKIDGGRFWFPNVVYVEFKGVNPETGEVVIERFKPQ
jgi:Domain of unknown function (DUF4833)